ncbi:MAG TPA: hypothetical protein VEU30_15185 [Thermoanaerobaculia bacterium]|nr:hypothetical protein [Thermoanaerobaculia bacterium]
MNVRIAIALLFLTVSASADEPLAPLQFMVGEWRGTSRGEPGEGTVHRVCERVLRDRFIECRTTVTYENEVHVDRALFSYDKGAKKLRLRQFHGEGFVNTYEAEGLVFTTTAIENIPAGWRARESYERPSPDTWNERFELAGPGKEFTLYSASSLRRAK